MQSGELNFDGRQIEYRFAHPAGAGGLDLVMLHEGLGSVSMWRDFPEQLARATGCRTLVYSRHGYGRSAPLAAPRGVDYMHEEARIWLPAILARLDIRRPVLFGHSDGGSIALIHAARPESDVAGIIVLSPHVKVEQLTVDSIEAAKSAYTDSDLRNRLSRHHADVDAAFWDGTGSGSTRHSAAGTSKRCCPRSAARSSRSRVRMMSTARWNRSGASAGRRATHGFSACRLVDIRRTATKRRPYWPPPGISSRPSHAAEPASRGTCSNAAAQPTAPHFRRPRSSQIPPSRSARRRVSALLGR